MQLLNRICKLCQLVMMVVNTPHGWQVLGLHVLQEVRAPQTFELDQACIACVILDHDPTVRHVTIVKDSTNK